MTFEELGLQSNLLKGITDLGFTEPTPIQQKTIPLLLNNSTDLVALAQTGTGKTAAFGLPLLGRIDCDNRITQALVLAPTRELCMQITGDLKKYSKYFSNFSICAIYGGARIDGQIKEVRKGVQVIVATPGRLIDMIERKVVNLNTVKYIVLDEADEMLNMGFKEDLDIILKETPKDKNTWLFSATMPKEVERIAKNYMSKPAELSAGNKNEGAANIEHVYYLVHPRDRYPALKRVVDYYPEIFGIVFCRTKAETQEVADALIKDGYSADALHGDLSQSQRDFVMKRFRSKTLQMLVATDVAARGIDVNDVTHVINFNLPEDVENYTHRTGRTARAGKSGIAITIITPKEQSRIRDIERILKKKFERKNVPTGVEVCEKQLFNLVHKLHSVSVKDDEIETFLPKIYEELKDLSKEELIKRFISEEFNRFHEYYEDAQDLNTLTGNTDGAFGNSRVTRFFINMGMMDGFNRNSLKDYLADAVKLHPRMIFNLDIKSSFSFFETESKFVDTFLAINSADTEFNNRKVQLEVSKKKMSEGGGNRSGGGGGGFRGNGSGGYRGGERSNSGKSGGFKRRDDNEKRPRKFVKKSSSEGGGRSYGDKPAKKGFGKSRF
ncbi:MAG: DEAD/DEAH box helicase [Sphingobacteriaceae bacterium]|nr:DEAD/DEAH box helicase [Sphingobacteriaceae bacterium]